MNLTIPEINCSVVLERLTSNGSMLNRSKIVDCLLSLCRNDTHDCVLLLKDRKQGQNSKHFTMDKNKGNYQLNTKFVSDGKCSIMLHDYNVRLFISNCPSNDLSIFLKGFALKCNNMNQIKSKCQLFSDENSPKTINKMKKSRYSTIEKISPLTNNDLLKAISFRDRKNDLLNKQTIPTSSPLGTKKNIQKRKLETIWEQLNETSPTTRKKVLISVIPSPVRSLKILNQTNLTQDQSKVVSAVMQGQNVFFTGSAGTGKSYLLKFLISRLPPDSTYVTASTGIAACQINGITLHLFSGISSSWLEEITINNETKRLSPVEIVSKLGKNALKIQRWKNCKCLIIDEISMVSGHYFQMLDSVARIIRKKDQPFGGIQVIVCGDFLQLPPISRIKEKKYHAFQTKSWQEAIKYCFELRKIQRQTDKTFINILQLIRIGQMNTLVQKSLINASKNNLRKNQNIIPTQLFPLRQDVDAVNKSQLMKLSSDSMFYNAQDCNSIYSTILDGLCPTPRKLELKLGAQVMLNKNIDIQRGLVNGLTGTIVGFENESYNSTVKLPRIQFVNGIDTLINYDRWSFKIKDNHSVYRRHLPLQLAWALSVHKSQGMTISNGVEISLGKIFEAGQAYVALSRSTSLENIKILDFNLNNIIVDNDALEFYRNLKYVL